jgi:hypothetical protein
LSEDKTRIIFLPSLPSGRLLAEKVWVKWLEQIAKPGGEQLRKVFQLEAVGITTQ